MCFLTEAKHSTILPICCQKFGQNCVMYKEASPSNAKIASQLICKSYICTGLSILFNSRSEFQVQFQGQVHKMKLLSLCALW